MVLVEVFLADAGEKFEEDGEVGALDCLVAVGVDLEAPLQALLLEDWAVDDVPGLSAFCEVFDYEFALLVGRDELVDEVEFLLCVGVDELLLAYLLDLLLLRLRKLAEFLRIDQLLLDHLLQLLDLEHLLANHLRVLPQKLLLRTDLIQHLQPIELRILLYLTQPPIPLLLQLPILLLYIFQYPLFHLHVLLDKR